MWQELIIMFETKATYLGKSHLCYEISKKTA